MRLIKISFALCLLLFICVEARSQSSRLNTYPNAAMKEFSKALLSKDKTKFLSFFSKTTSFVFANPMNEYRSNHTYKELEKDLKNKTNLYFLMEDRTENGDLDCFRDYFENGASWRRVGSYKFVPKDNDDNSDTFILWRKEGNQWVIAEISYPSA